MADHDIIKEYLVKLGFAVDNVELRKFEDSLKRTGIAAEKFAKNMSIGFVAAGGAIVTALAAVGAGTVALATNVARQDLAFQIFARRMFIGTDAARKMKIALDSLGYSMEEIIWGPPELAERYRQLITDQTNMIKIMGGDTGERAFRKIRDIEFQFTRMGPELVIFSRKLTEDIIVKMFGSMDNLENKLKGLNDWFQSNIPSIAAKITAVLVPAFEKFSVVVGAAYDKIVGIGQWLGILPEHYTRAQAQALGWSNALAPGESEFRSQDKSLLGKVRPEDENRAFLAQHPFQRQLREMSSGHNYVQEIIDAAHKFGLPPALLLAIARKESGLNPYAPLGGKGEVGEFQLLPDTIKKLESLGVITDPYDPSQNIIGGAYWLSHKPGPTLQDKVQQYNGSGAAAEDYRRKVWADYAKSPTYQPQSFHSDMGGVTINITSPNATPEQIKKVVKEAIDDHVRVTSSRNMAQRQGTYV
jgi:hypothetical protein